MTCINRMVNTLTFEHCPLEKQFMAGTRESSVLRNSFKKLGFLDL